MALRFRAFISILAGISFSGLASAGLLGPLSESDWDASAFNVITLGNGSDPGNFNSNSDVGGRVAVFGSFTDPAGVNSQHFNPYAETYALIVNGSWGNNNPITVGGTGTQSVYVPATGQTPSRLFNSPVPNVVTPPANSDFNFADARTALDTLSSTTIPGDAQDATVTKGPSYYTLDLTGLASGLYVLNVPYADLSDNNDPFEINLNTNQTAILNVTGAPANATLPKGTVINYGGQQVGQTTTGGVPVLFNFANVTSLNAQSQFSGTILAPLAMFNSNSSVDGQLIVASVQNSGEIHDQHFNESISTLQSVPEPITLVLAGGGLIAIGLMRKRR